MKTMMNILKLSMLSMAFCLNLSCNSDDDTPAPDPRADFMENFEMQDFEMLITLSQGGNQEDTLVVVASNPEMKFRLEEGLDENELMAETKEFTESLLDRLLLTVGSVGFTSDVEVGESPVEISAPAFVIGEFNSSATLSDGSTTELINFYFTADGELEAGELTMDYELGFIFDGINFELTGTAVGEKE